MTDPTDSLADTLRRALSETAGAYTPGADGLEKIQARIGGRPPRPRLLSVLAHGAERARYFTWRGHWAWPRPTVPSASAGARPAGRPVRGAHRRSRPNADWGIGGLRLVSVVGGIAVIAGLSFGVQPFRHAIIQVSSNVLDGHSPAGSGGGGADGNGTQTSDQEDVPAGVGANGQPGGATGSGQPSAGASGIATGCAPSPGSSETVTPGKTAPVTGATPNSRPSGTARGAKTATAPATSSAQTKTGAAACVPPTPTTSPSGSASPALSPTAPFPTRSPSPTDDSDGGDWSDSASDTPTDGSGDGHGGSGWSPHRGDPTGGYPYGNGWHH